jgi:hypothetical protein
VENICKFATRFDDKGRGTISVDTAPFQADPDIAGLAILFATDVILSGDSDFPMYVGPAGSGDLMIRAPKICMKTASVKSATLVTGQLAIKDSVLDIL